MSDTSLANLPAPAAAHSRDILFAAGIMGILVILFLPLPSVLIDFGLAVSIAVSVLILMVALWIERPLAFSAFPTILLIATMLRLSLNIATTRAILAEGHQGEHAAGDVIAGFARFVMGGDFVIGIIVFAILVIINFIVISKGATRIAEVSARFTLDAIPGKQMAIDADLSAGLITSAEAQARRRELEEESAFYGAMDGASKFVRGDAVAGLIITLVNILGGIVIGALRYDMPMAEAADVFTKLSVGDGLVSQIPALIVSVAAGLIVSKGGVMGAAHQTVIGQFTRHPKALTVSAGLLLLLGLAPGLPFIPFLLLAAAFFSAGIVIPRRMAQAANLAAEMRKAEEATAQRETRESVKAHLAVARIELALGRQLSARMLSGQDELAGRVARMRKRFARDYGFVVPEITLGDDLDLASKGYSIRIHGTEVARGTLAVGEVQAILGNRPMPDLPVTEIREAAFGLRAITAPAVFAPELRRLGFDPVEDMSVLLTHLGETLLVNLAQLLSFRDMRALLDRLEPEYQRLLDDICPAQISQSVLQAVLKNLLSEQVSIRNLALILEAVAEVSSHVKRPEMIAEHVRTRLASQICGDVAHAGTLRILRVGTRWTDMFVQALRRDPRGEITGFDLSPGDIEAFGSALQAAIKVPMEDGRRFVLMTAPEARIYVRMVAERLNPALPVLSHAELARGAAIELIGTVE